MTVIDLDSRRPHWAGLASCLSCQHEWAAAAPIDTHDLQCPSCSEMQGVKFSVREIQLIRALEMIHTGRSGEGAGVDLSVTRDIARSALCNVGWPPYATPTPGTAGEGGQ